MSEVVIVNSLGEHLPDGEKVPLKCEVPSCMDEAHGWYTTCAKHTGLLHMSGVPLKIRTRPMYAYNSPIPLGDTVYDFRFSASYASRYSNCHGSANLEEAIPGFVHPERNDHGMKGEGTRLHKIFEDAVRGGKDLRLKAKLLRDLSEVWGPKRTALLENEREFIIWWFMPNKCAPPIERQLLQDNLLQYVQAIKPDRTPKFNEDGSPLIVAKGIQPRRLVTVAEALEYVADIIDKKDPETLEIFVEEKVTADWLETKPKTTVDLVIKDKDSLDVLDLKMGDIEVKANGNEQLMYYGETFGASEYDNVTLHIMQRNNTNSWAVQKAVMQAWKDKVLRAEQAIVSGDLTLSPGSHCTFCPANPHSRGDKGSKACPAMMHVLYGERDAVREEQDILEGDYEDE